jgi:hypothetical protein
MVVRVIATLLLVCFSIGLGGSVAGAQTQFWAPYPTPYQSYYKQPCSKKAPYEVALGLRKFINSFTSYQFPNPFPPNQDPLSRLEFPIDHWFVGMKGSYCRSVFTVIGEGWTNLNRTSGAEMQDSDWDDETMPFQKTIFSSSKCALNRSWLGDVGLAIGRSSSTASVRPIGGYRIQSFNFTTYDGVQMDLAGTVTELPGNGIDFQQVYHHFYLGGLFATSLGGGGYFGCPSTIQLTVQGDVAAINGRNEDKHLLRDGDRVTVERTRGYCWHVALGANLDVRNLLRLKLEGDFKRVVTTGSHNLTNGTYDIDFSFEGARVWSDQATLSAMGELRF